MEVSHGKITLWIGYFYFFKIKNCEPFKGFFCVKNYVSKRAKMGI